MLAPVAAGLLLNFCEYDFKLRLVSRLHLDNF